MAKVIKYFRCIEENEENLIPVEMGWNEGNEEIAKLEAYNGEYTIEDEEGFELYGMDGFRSKEEAREAGEKKLKEKEERK